MAKYVVFQQEAQLLLIRLVLQ